MTARENEYCILDYKKKCDNCGECERCDINPNKKCNNCGKCMEEEGYDMRAIKIDKVICNNEKVESTDKLHNLEVSLAENENSKYEVNDEKNNKSNLNSEDSEGNTGDSQDDSDPVDAWGPNIEYIDDIEGLNDLLKDIKKLDGSANKNAYEEFPGLIRLKNKKYRN